MPARSVAALAAAFTLIVASPAAGLELGVQDDGAPADVVAEWSANIGARWQRMIAYVGQPGVALRIRAAHHNGQQVILTVGGIGTRTRKPTGRELLRYIRSLPRADRYTVVNEVDLTGMSPCRYWSIWRIVRRVLGARLLFGDFSPARPLTFTQAIAASCEHAHLPRVLDFAVHPYQWNDPFAKPDERDWAQGGIGNLVAARKWLRRNAGVRVRWWLDEFGYPAALPDEMAAFLWPRAIRQASRVRARVLIAYTAKGSSWDTRPGPLAWCSLARGRACQDAKPLRTSVDIPFPLYR